MNFKEFFKLTLTKILVTLAIFLLILLAPIVKLAIYCVGPDCGRISYQSLFITLRSTIPDSTLTIISLLISYLISCLILSLIKKRA